MKNVEVCVDWSRDVLCIGERQTNYAYEKIRVSSTQVIGTCAADDFGALRELRKKCMRRALHKMTKQLNKASHKVEVLTAELESLTKQLEETNNENE